MNSACLPALQLMTSQALSSKVSGSEHSPWVPSKGAQAELLYPGPTHTVGFPLPCTPAQLEPSINVCQAHLPLVLRQMKAGPPAKGCHGEWARRQMQSVRGTKEALHSSHHHRPPVSDGWNALSLLSRIEPVYPHPCLTDLYDPTKCLIPSKHSRIGSLYE